MLDLTFHASRIAHPDSVKRGSNVRPAQARASSRCRGNPITGACVELDHCRGLSLARPNSNIEALPTGIDG